MTLEYIQVMVQVLRAANQSELVIFAQWVIKNRKTMGCWLLTRTNL